MLFVIELELTNHIPHTKLSTPPAVLILYTWALKLVTFRFASLWEPWAFKLDILWWWQHIHVKLLDSLSRQQFDNEEKQPQFSLFIHCKCQYCSMQDWTTGSQYQNGKNRQSDRRRCWVFVGVDPFGQGWDQNVAQWKHESWSSLCRNGLEICSSKVSRNN